MKRKTLPLPQYAFQAFEKILVMACNENLPTEKRCALIAKTARYTMRLIVLDQLEQSGLLGENNAVGSG